LAESKISLTSAETAGEARGRKGGECNVVEGLPDETREILDFRFQESCARLEMEALFAEGLPYSNSTPAEIGASYRPATHISNRTE
jgi:hypothetical protein